MADDDVNFCTFRWRVEGMPPWHCSLEANHEGPHEAWGFMRDEPFATCENA